MATKRSRGSKAETGTRGVKKIRKTKRKRRATPPPPATEQKPYVYRH